MEKMFTLLAEEEEMRDVPNAGALHVTCGGIEFCNVSFHYSPNRKILRNISFKVPGGHSLALVGHTGSGKSTILRLLFRFYDVTSGQIKVDGQDISQVTLASLRQALGVVPQDTVLFHGDIRHNIHYGRLCADLKEVEEAARAADIHDFILSLPQGYETVVGERGQKLSGGERQRLAIARVFLQSPAIVLLDEATSSLDSKTEESIMKSLLRLCKNRTTIFVAHRLSTIAHCHQILVLHEGEVVEQGRHEELLQRNGHYAAMWQQQLGWSDSPARDTRASTGCSDA